MFGNEEDTGVSQPQQDMAAPATNDWQQTEAAASEPAASPAIQSAQPAASAQPAVNLPQPVATPSSSFGGGTASSVDLAALKQQALQQLSPLVGQLDQTPEEKFRTMMMMIQATDNKDLLSEAYSAAGMIADEKVKAQALLDVVNEINYFTQNQ